MSKRPSASSTITKQTSNKVFVPAKKKPSVVATTSTTASTTKKEAPRQPSCVPNLTELDIDIVVSDSDSDTASKPTKLPSVTNNLRVTDTTFELITSFITRIAPLARQRENYIRIHEGMVTAINAGGVPTNTRVNANPHPPPNTSFGQEFLSAYRQKAKECSIKLGGLMVAEYKRIIKVTSQQIDDIRAEAEGVLFDISDTTERDKAVELFGIKFTNQLKISKRRNIKPKRRINRT